MEVLGFSLNMLSLLGMVLAIGLVVDDAIVVVENVERQLEAGLAAARGREGGDGRGDGADHRDDRGADGGVRAGRLHSRRRRPALQPVRADGRDLGRHFGLQLADPQPGAQRGVAAPSAAKASFLLFRWFNAGFDRLSHAYARIGPAVSSGFGWALVAVFVAGLVGDLRALAQHLRRPSCRSRTRAISSS